MTMTADFDALIEPYHEALGAIINGDPSVYKEFFSKGDDVTLGNPRPVPGGPTVRLRLVSIMGGSDVKRGRKLSWSERRAQRGLHRGHWH